jgi:hypothetical protein
MRTKNLGVIAIMYLFKYICKERYLKKTLMIVCTVTKVFTKIGNLNLSVIGYECTLVGRFRVWPAIWRVIERMNYVLYNESNWQCPLSTINLRPTNRTTLKLLEHMLSIIPHSVIQIPQYRTSYMYSASK